MTTIDRPLLDARTIASLRTIQREALAIPGLALAPTTWAVATPPLDDGGPTAPVPTISRTVEGRVTQGRASRGESAPGQPVGVRPWLFVLFVGDPLPIGAVLSADGRRFRVGPETLSPTYPTYLLEAL